MADDLAKGLDDLDNLRKATKERASKVFELLREKNEPVECGGWTFHIVRKRKGVPFNAKLVTEAITAYNKRRRTEHPIDEDFLKFVHRFREKKLESAEEQEVLKKKRNKPKV